MIIKRQDFYTEEYSWRLVKGGVEVNEDEMAALGREIKEEVGLKKIHISKKILNYSFHNPHGIKINVSIFLVYSNKTEKLVLSGEERIIDAKWVSSDIAISLLKYDPEKNAVRKTLKLISTL